MVMSVRNILGVRKSSMLVAVFEGLSKGKPMARLSGYSASRRPQKLDASTQLTCLPSLRSTCGDSNQDEFKFWDRFLIID